MREKSDCKLTSFVRLATLVRTRPFCANHHIRTCSAELIRSSNSLMKASNSIVFCSSLNRNAGSSCSLADKMSPVAPSPHKDALKRSGRSFAEQNTVEPSASNIFMDRTMVDMTPKPMPVPCVAVVMMPAKVWSEMEPQLESARSCLAMASCSSSKTIPPCASAVHFSVLIY